MSNPGKQCIVGSAVKTSVIIPVFNTAQYLPACLDSVLAQTQSEIEVILVDDGSTDGSLDIEYAYAARDPRVRVVQQSHLRQGSARNRGLAEARGEFVYFMDSDDLIVPTMFETCYAACEHYQLDFATFDTAGFEDDPNIERPELFDMVCDRSQFVREDVMDGVTFWAENHGPGYLYWVCWLEYFRRSFLVENDLRFVEGIYFEDNDWIVRVFLAARRLKYLPQKMHRYRARPNSNVHSGFTEDLAWSSFDVFDIVMNLRSQQDTLERSEMVDDIMYGVSMKFRRFGELPYEQKLAERTVAFSHELREKCEDRTIPLELRRVCLRVLFGVEAGLFAWPGCGAPIPRALVDEILLSELPSEARYHRLGLYGTGKACAYLLRIWDTSKRDVIAIETKPPTGKTFDGMPVHGVDDIPNLDLDAIVITSERNAEAMRASIAHVVGDELPVFVLTHYILMLDVLDNPVRVQG